MKKAIALSVVLLLPAMFMLAMVPVLDGAADTYYLGELGVEKCRMSLYNGQGENIYNFGTELGIDGDVKGVKVAMDTCDDAEDALENVCFDLIGDWEFDCQFVGQAHECQELDVCSWR